MKNLRTLALAAALVLCAAALAAETPFRTILAPKAPNAFSLYQNTGFDAKLECLTFEGAPVFKVVLEEAPEMAKNNQQVQFRLLMPAGTLEPGTEYRIRFRCRSDRPANISFRCQESATPWTEVSERLSGTVALSPEWKYVEYCLTPYEDGNGKAVWFPNFELGRLGKGNAFYISDLVVEALD